jgi:hypothetical protein
MFTFILGFVVGAVVAVIPLYILLQYHHTVLVPALFNLIKKQTDSVKTKL